MEFAFQTPKPDQTGVAVCGYAGSRKLVWGAILRWNPRAGTGLDFSLAQASGVASCRHPPDFDMKRNR
jgi:hypothetical protein